MGNNDIYTLKQYFLISTPGIKLMNENAVGVIASLNLFGDSFSKIITIGISLILLSSISVQIMVGPRVYYAMSKDKIIFRSLSRVNARFQTPDLAIFIQVIIAIIYVFIGEANINNLLVYMGFSLSIFPLLTVIGLVIMRYKAPELNRPYKVPFFPYIPFFYIALSVFMMVASIVQLPKESFTAIFFVLLGIVFYYWYESTL
ncbi:MAG: hypothetical protein OMM_09476 [Candidatus Magnetoglobus multicellularis str. Araruama]|uniref:Amino acid permease n=1 Tax=Candidatus Magnetoglobus multicellularis str. Araruama TaxID=890399 RepID=A0A1V1P4C3_9BACT|nr:MAG: hypothetical protein OMM_09476 [Candidatus Magnetoglobus multicellularis str. Araruama]